MKLPTYTTKDRWLILILLPPIILVVNYFIFGDHYFERLDMVLWSFFITGAIGFTAWHILLAVSLQMQARYPLRSQTFIRLFFAVSLHLILTALTITLIFGLYDLLNFSGYKLNLTRLKWALLSGVFINIMTTTLIESIAYYERWEKATDETEALRKENLQTQLDSLKAQVNPHFLFNSLNTLCSLISEDPPKAEKFLLKLSKVYRYLLVSSEENLATLSTEMQFIQSYFHLLKTRYGESVTLTIRIDEQHLACKLPSLTLQILVENAVKHNVMEKERPLNILIATTDNGKLLIQNNLQQKIRGIKSNKVGLVNIGKKYKLLKQEDIEVNQDGGYFSVIIPLIKNSP